MLIVHSKFLDMNEDKKKLKNPKLIDFDPLKEEGFLSNLYDRKSLGKGSKDYEYRHGLTPGTKNIKNNRWKKKLNENDFPKSKITDIEHKLQAIIDRGFLDNVEEKLLKFDAAGKLIETIEVPKFEDDDEQLGDNCFQFNAEEEEMMYEQEQ